MRFASHMLHISSKTPSGILVFIYGETRIISTLQKALVWFISQQSALFYGSGFFELGSLTTLLCVQNYTNADGFLKLTKKHFIVNVTYLLY